MAAMMKATVFVAPGRIELVDKPIPDVGPNDALIRITTTTICGTDVHILKGEYPVVPGLTIGHEPVGKHAEIGLGRVEPAGGHGRCTGLGRPGGKCQGQHAEPQQLVKPSRHRPL
jgi:threonine dehydrogenase-like Zn-dependent dehydrogenase